MSSNTDVSTTRAYSDDQLAEIGSFQDALNLASANGGAEEWSDYGSGFDVLDDKAQLIKKPFVILEWRFNKSDINDGVFVSAVCVTEDGRKLILNDGSTGIKDQLLHVTSKREARKAENTHQHLICRNGLRRSDYSVDLPDKNGELRATKATTYYLA